MASVCVQQPYLPVVKQEISGCGEPPPLIPILSKTARPPPPSSASSCAQQASASHAWSGNYSRQRKSGDQSPFLSARIPHRQPHTSVCCTVPVETTLSSSSQSRNVRATGDRHAAHNGFSDDVAANRVMAQDLAEQPAAIHIVAAYQSYMEKKIQDRRRALQHRLLQRRTAAARLYRNAETDGDKTTTAHSPRYTVSATISAPVCFSASETRPTAPAETLTSAGSGELTQNHFTHLFSQQDINDGFDPERANHLQSQITEDPSARKLPDGKVVFGCSQCEVSFVWRRHLERHFEKHRSQSKSMLCRLCGKCFTRPDHLNRHCNTAHGNHDIPCQLCGELFQRASHLDRHWTSAHKANDFLPEGCPPHVNDCGSPTTRSSSNVGDRTVSDVATSHGMSRSPGMPVHCMLDLGKCTIPYKPPTSTQFTSVVSSTHGPIVSSRITSAVPSTASLSPTPSYDSSSLGSLTERSTEILGNSSDPFSCFYCGRNFPRRSFLRAHIATTHAVRTVENQDEEMMASDSSTVASLPPLIRSSDDATAMDDTQMDEDGDEDHGDDHGAKDNDDACSYQVECSDTEWPESPYPFSMSPDGHFCTDQTFAPDSEED